MVVAWASPWARSTGCEPEVGLERRPRLGPPVRRGPVELDPLLLGAPAGGEGLGPGDEHAGRPPAATSSAARLTSHWGIEPPMPEQRASARLAPRRRASSGAGSPWRSDSEWTMNRCVSSASTDSGCRGRRCRRRPSRARRLHELEGVGRRGGVLLAVGQLAGAHHHRDPGPVHCHAPSSSSSSSGVDAGDALAPIVCDESDLLRQRSARVGIGESESERQPSRASTVPASRVVCCPRAQSFFSAKRPRSAARIFLRVAGVAAGPDRGVDVGGLGPQGRHRALLPGPLREGVEAEQTHGVLVGDLVHLGVGHAGQVLHGHLGGVGPRRVGVGVVALPAHVVELQEAPALHAEGVVDEAGDDALVEHLAGEHVAEVLARPPCGGAGRRSRPARGSTGSTRSRPRTGRCAGWGTCAAPARRAGPPRTG